MLQGQRDLVTVGRLLLSELAPLVNAQQGVIYQLDEETATLKLLSSYADGVGQPHPAQLRLSEGLVGQCAADKKPLLIDRIPDSVIPIGSGIFAARAKNVTVLPVLVEAQVETGDVTANIGGFNSF